MPNSPVFKGGKQEIKNYTDLFIEFAISNIIIVSTIFNFREMIFLQPFFDNIYDNFLSYIYMFLLSLYIALVFISIHYFLCNYGCLISCHWNGLLNNTILNFMSHNHILNEHVIVIYYNFSWINKSFFLK